MCLNKQEKLAESEALFPNYFECTTDDILWCNNEKNKGKNIIIKLSIEEINYFDMLNAFDKTCLPVFRPFPIIFSIQNHIPRDKVDW